MEFRTQTTFERYCDDTPWEIKMKEECGYAKIKDYNRYGNPEVSVPIYQAELTRDEFLAVVLEFGVLSQENILDGVSLLSVYCYEELPRDVLEIPVSMVSYWTVNEEAE